MNSTEAASKFQAGEITIDELTAILTANEKARVEADNKTRHPQGTVQIFSDIRTDLTGTK